MKYKILNADSSSVLEQAVWSFLSEGWELQGGVSVAYAEYEVRDYEGSRDTVQTAIFAQAMIKRE